MCPTENWLFASGSRGDDFEIVSGSLISSYIEADRLKKTNVKKKKTVVGNCDWLNSSEV